MITIEELDQHIKVVNKANNDNKSRKPKNKLVEYCFECKKAYKEYNAYWSCSWNHHIYYGDLVVLYNMMRYFLRVNRNRKTLKNKFGRSKKLPHGFSPDVQDLMIEKAKELDRNRKFG